MYNQTYINDFNSFDYSKYLNDPQELIKIKKEYLKQYKENSNAVMLAFKESLDHYVLKKVLEDEKYLDSTEFKNYLNYLMHIVEEKTDTLNGEKLNIELCSNIIFRNDEIRNKILKKNYNQNTINIFDSNIKKVKDRINSIFKKMVNREKISQEEIDLVGDYIYSSRNFNNDIGRIFAEYLFNEITPESNIRVSPQILGAITSYFTQCYTIDEDVKNSRTFIADYDENSSDLAHKSGSKKYCYFNRKIFSTISLINDSSLNKSRTFNDKDLYFLMMVAFHELTHEHQHNEAERNNNSSSAMSYIIKNVINQNTECFELTDKNGNKVKKTEYQINHDSTEYEMQADEESWRQCESFISKHCRQYAYNHKLDTKIIMKRERKCLKNEKAIRARRSFSFKKNIDGGFLYYATYDMKNLVKIAQKNPSILKLYPILKNYINENGELNTSILFSSNITSTDNTGLDVDNTALEFATYMIDEEKEAILKKISEGSLTEAQIQNLIMNIYNVQHQNILKVRDFKEIDKDGYKNTDHYYNLENKSAAIYKYYFMKHASEIYTAMELIYKIHECYPEVDLTKYDDRMYYIGTFYDIFKELKRLNIQIEEQKIIELCRKYDNSQVPILLELSNFMKENILKANNQNNNKDDNIVVDKHRR